MTPEETARIARVMAPLCALFPNEEMPDDRLRAYALTLSDIEPHLLEASIVHVMSTVKFFPKPAEIRQAAAELRARAAGIPDPYEAWNSILDAIRVGAGEPMVGDAFLTEQTIARRKVAIGAIHVLANRAAINIGGLASIGRSDNLTADRARFVDAYRELVARHMGDQVMLPIVREAVERLALPVKAEAR